MPVPAGDVRHGEIPDALALVVTALLVAGPRSGAMEDWSAWINLTKTEGELLRPLPRGLLDVAKVVRASADPSALPSTEPRSTHVSQARPAPLNQPSGDASSTPLSGFGFDGKACGLWD